ncbi:unnamed protein product, partial [Aureobasidium pullulans]
QAIHASSAPKPNGNYSHVVREGNTLHIACLLAANSSLDKIVRRRIYLMKMSDFRKVDEIWAEYFEEPYPVSTCVQVSGLAKEGALVELEVVAQA